MQFKKIQGNSYYIRGGTNTGIFRFNEDYAIIIDPGLSTIRGTKIAHCLTENQLTPTHCLCTHEHLDHYEAYTGVLEIFPECIFCCPEKSAPFIEIPTLFYTYVYGAHPNQQFFGNTRPEVFNFTIRKKLNEERLLLSDNFFVDILDLSGHSHGMAGVLTQDRVLFLGDSLFDYNIIKKYEFPFIFHVEHFLNSLTKIKACDFDFGVISHSKSPYSKKDICHLADINAENVAKYLEQIYDLLQTPHTRENILAAIINANSFNFNYKEYHYYYSTLGSMLSYLYDRGQIDSSIDKGLLYYHRAERPLSPKNNH